MSISNLQYAPWLDMQVGTIKASEITAVDVEITNLILDNLTINEDMNVKGTLGIGVNQTSYTFPNTVGTIGKVLGVVSENELGFINAGGPGGGITDIINTDGNLVPDVNGNIATLDLSSNITLTKANDTQIILNTNTEENQNVITIKDLTTNSRPDVIISKDEIQCYQLNTDPIDGGVNTVYLSIDADNPINPWSKLTVGNDYYLKTDVNGNLSWAPVSGGGSGISNIANTDNNLVIDISNNTATIDLCNNVVVGTSLSINGPADQYLSLDYQSMEIYDVLQENGNQAYSQMKPDSMIINNGVINENITTETPRVINSLSQIGLSIASDYNDSETQYNEVEIIPTQIQLTDTVNGNTLTITSSNINLPQMTNILPQNGTNGQLLKTNGDGTVGWVSETAQGTIDNSDGNLSITTNEGTTTIDFSNNINIVNLTITGDLSIPAVNPFTTLTPVNNSFLSSDINGNLSFVELSPDGVQSISVNTNHLSLEGTAENPEISLSVSGIIYNQNITIDDLSNNVLIIKSIGEIDISPQTPSAEKTTIGLNSIQCLGIDGTSTSTLSAQNITVQNGTNETQISDTLITITDGTSYTDIQSANITLDSNNILTSIQNYMSIHDTSNNQITMSLNLAQNNHPLLTLTDGTDEAIMTNASLTINTATIAGITYTNTNAQANYVLKLDNSNNAIWAEDTAGGNVNSVSGTQNQIDVNPTSGNAIVSLPADGIVYDNTFKITSSTDDLLIDPNELIDPVNNILGNQLTIGTVDETSYVQLNRFNQKFQYFTNNLELGIGTEGPTISLFNNDFSTVIEDNVINVEDKDTGHISAITPEEVSVSDAGQTTTNNTATLDAYSVQMVYTDFDVSANNRSNFIDKESMTIKLNNNNLCQIINNTIALNNPSTNNNTNVNTSFISIGNVSTSSTITNATISTHNSTNGFKFDNSGNVSLYNSGSWNYGNQYDLLMSNGSSLPNSWYSPTTTEVFNNINWRLGNNAICFNTNQIIVSRVFNQVCLRFSVVPLVLQNPSTATTTAFFDSISVNASSLPANYQCVGQIEYCAVQGVGGTLTYGSRMSVFVSNLGGQLRISFCTLPDGGQEASFTNIPNLQYFTFGRCYMGTQTFITPDFWTFYYMV